MDRDKHETKQITIDCIEFKRVIFEEFKIETEIHFLTTNNFSFKLGLVYSQLKI